MKTLEEKRAAAKERARRKAETLRRLPHAYLSSQNPKVSLGLWIGQMSIHIDGFHRHVDELVAFECELSLNDPVRLGSFIRALVARYNVLVEEANAVAAQCAMDQLKPIEGSPE